MPTFATLTREEAHCRLPWLSSLSADRVEWPPWTEQQFLMDLRRKWDLSFFSDCGVAILSEREPRHVHLHLLAIHPDCRGKGHGAVMLTEAKRRASGVLELKAPGDEPDVLRFYRSHGFRLISDPGQRWVGMQYSE
jgi:GNAT superfamily N-acetyltransferase